MTTYAKGDFVKIFFDDNWGGGYLYGCVVQSGPKAYTVEWESGLRNRFIRDGFRHEPERVVSKPDDYRGVVVAAMREEQE